MIPGNERSACHAETSLCANNVRNLHAVSDDLRIVCPAMAHRSQPERALLIASDRPKLHIVDCWKLHLWVYRERRIRLDRGDHLRVFLQSMAQRSGSFRAESGGTIRPPMTRLNPDMFALGQKRTYAAQHIMPLYPR